MCLSSQRQMDRRIKCSSILAIIAAVFCFIIGLSAFFTPLLVLADAHIQFLIGFIIVFIMLLVSGILGCCGVMRQKSCCTFAMFLLNVMALLSISGSSRTISSIWQFYQPIRKAPDCATRYEHVSELVNIGSSTFAAALCSPNCLCDFTRDSTTVLAGSIASNGVIKIQDCTFYWRSQFDAPASVMAQLETLYDCTGFCATPLQNRFTFTDINKYNQNSECGPKFQIYVGVALGPTYFMISGTWLITLVAVILQLLNYCSKKTESRTKLQTVVVPSNETEQELRPY